MEPTPAAPARWQPTPLRLSSDGSEGPAGPCGPAAPAGPTAPTAPGAPASPFAPAAPAGPAGAAGPPAPGATGTAERAAPRPPRRFQLSRRSLLRHAPAIRTIPLFLFTHALTTPVVLCVPPGCAASATPATRASGSATSSTRVRNRRIQGLLSVDCAYRYRRLAPPLGGHAPSGTLSA